ncbi:MAG: hypothetical protein LUE17_00830 [Planctomycetaceae bacterium]|nr:hypothetical protein [Planctomycetaceae bacterium]
MRKYLTLTAASLCFMAGCAAYGSEAAVPGGDGGIILSLIKSFGPMAGVIIWFMHRQKTYDTLVVDCTKATTALNATLNEFRADMEKMRVILYQLRDEARMARRKSDVLKHTGESHEPK